jgi:hypothetical protein
LPTRTFSDTSFACRPESLLIKEEGERSAEKEGEAKMVIQSLLGARILILVSRCLRVFNDICIHEPNILKTQFEGARVESSLRMV